jgi:lysozyme
MVLEAGDQALPPATPGQVTQLVKLRVAAAACVVSAGLLIGIAFKEGYRDEAYPDPASGGAPWTIGFGETRGVQQRDRTTPLHALAQLGQSVDRHAAGVAGCLSQPVSQGEFEASVSLAYNIGVGAYCASSVAKRFNEQDYWGGCMALLLYTRARIRGELVVMPGLVTRRWDEYQVCVAR